MASAQVAVRISPYELQLIDEGLKLLLKVAASHIDGGKPDLTINWKLTDGDPRQMAHEASQLRRDLGIK